MVGFVNSTLDLTANQDTAKNVPWEWSEKIDLKPLYSVELVEEDGKHSYIIGNDPTLHPGVTGPLDCIAKAPLIPWIAKATAEYTKKILLRIRGLRMPDERFYETLYLRSKKQPRFAKETAARIGSNAHKIFDDILKSKGNGKSTPFMKSFQFFLENEKLRIVGGDTKVGSLNYGYGGSLDVLLMDNSGRIVIGDFKTGNYIFDTHAFQLSAYSQAFKETYGLDYLPNGVVFRFEKDKPKYERREVADIQNSFLAFKAALDLYRLLKQVHFKNRQTIKPTIKKDSASSEAYIA